MASTDNGKLRLMLDKASISYTVDGSDTIYVDTGSAEVCFRFTPYGDLLEILTHPSEDD